LKSPENLKVGEKRLRPRKKIPLGGEYYRGGGDRRGRQRTK